MSDFEIVTSKNGLFMYTVETKLISFLQKFFIFTGVWKSASDHNYNKTRSFFNLTFLLVGFVSILYMLVLKYDDLDVNTEILLHSVEIFHSICAHIMFIRKKQTILRLVKVLKLTLDLEKLPVKDKENCLLIIKKEQRFLLKTMKLAMLGILSVYVCVIFDSNAFSINGKKKLLYPSWFPFETDPKNVWFYYLAILFELVIYIELLCVDLATVGIWYGTIITVNSTLDILGHCFHTLGDQDKENYAESRRFREANIASRRVSEAERRFRVESAQNRRVSKEYRQKLKNCIDLHCFLKNLTKDLDATLGIIFMEVVFTSQVAICFCGFHVVQAIYTKELTRLLKFFVGVGVFTLMLFLFCSSGQKLKNKSDDFFNSLYFCPWYEQSPSLKKTFHFCQINSKRPLVVNGALVPANLQTFVNSMSAVFSYLNFLLAIKDSKK